jgi:alkanesulfonate monooxygenase SsuD/methylene tetrahydromethanopterin reductase-like flavin-dependent oxidoreductase (luciferase family)
MKFGIFDHVSTRGGPVNELYRGRLEFVAAADKAGFYCYHAAEHHQTPLGMAPSPNVYLAAVAARTKRMRIGSLVHLLPLYEPVRLIEEICMLDQLSDGRLDLGVGRGVSPYETGYFGVTPQESRVRYEEMLNIILKGLTSETLSHESLRYRYYDVPMTLRPLQRPYPPMWFGALSNDSLDQAAQYGANIVAGGPNAIVKAAVAAYPAFWAKHADKPWRRLSPTKEPILGMMRPITVADTDREAERMVEASFPYYMEILASLWKKWGGLPGVYIGSAKEALAAGAIVAGAPNTVRDRLAANIAATGIGYLVCSIYWGNLNHEQAMRSLTLLSKDVLPKLGTLAEAAE